MLIEDRGEHLRHVDINAHEGRQLLVGLGVSARGQTGQIPEHLIGLGRKQYEMPNVVVQQFKDVRGEIGMGAQFGETLGVIGLKLLIRLGIRR